MHRLEVSGATVCLREGGGRVCRRGGGSRFQRSGTCTSRSNKRRLAFPKPAEAERQPPAAWLSSHTTSAAPLKRLPFQLLNNEKGPREKTPSAPSKFSSASPRCRCCCQPSLRLVGWLGNHLPGLHSARLTHHIPSSQSHKTTTSCRRNTSQHQGLGGRAAARKILLRY